MGFKEFLVAALVVGCVSAQNSNFISICVSTTNSVLCQNLDKDGSQVVCEPVESKIDCAVKLAQGSADIGVFSEEEMLLLAHHQPNDNRVIASIRDVSRNEPYAFEAVVVVPASHTGGLEGLRGSSYCHPGFDQTELRWSPRVLKTFEQVVARTNRCPDASMDGKTAEELEVDTLSKFFGSACRPGPWSVNASVDADLKTRYPSLCSLCGEGSNCNSYTINMGINVAGIRNDNRHIQALECARSNPNATAYVAWQHVREFFNTRNPDEATSYALLCEDGSLNVLTTEALSSPTAPCSFVKQPWSAIVASTARAPEVQASLRSWFPDGGNPGGNSWQAVLFSAIVGGSNARLSFQESLITPQNYTQELRNLASIDATASCIPARRWCTTNPFEHTKCSWLRSAAYTLGIEPTISCQQRTSIFECFEDIRDNNADFIAAAANYGYLSRQHFKLTSVKLVQNSRSNPAAFSRVAAILKETSAQGDITRFENLRGKRACFPEFGGIAYVAFLNAAHERSVISASECDYARAVGEFFDGACAPGAMDISHSLTDSSYNATNLCTACQSSVSSENFTCAYDGNNLFYGNNGSVSCLADSNNDVAFVELQGIDVYLRAAGLEQNQVRVLCKNNTLAATTGTAVDNDCLLAYVVDSEVLTRRNDPLTNSLNALLDTLDLYFGYNAATSAQLINLEMYSPFIGISDLLFQDTAVGLSEPSSDSANEAARNYNNLFKHLDACTGSASPLPGLANRNFYSILTLVLTAFFTRFVVY